MTQNAGIISNAVGMGRQKSSSGGGLYRFAQSKVSNAQKKPAAPVQPVDRSGARRQAGMERRGQTLGGGGFTP